MFVNDFKLHKWLFYSIEFNQTPKNKFPPLVLKPPVLVLIDPIGASKRDLN